ncbi:hypothetical protein T439DRAFT_320159 [Meredithblackwellia eburnea MCA 4105]
MGIPAPLCFAATFGSIFCFWLSGILFLVPWGESLAGNYSRTYEISGTGAFFNGAGYSLQFASLLLWVLFAVHRVSNEQSILRQPSQTATVVVIGIAIVFNLLSTFIQMGAILSPTVTYKSQAGLYIVVNLFTPISQSAFSWAIVSATTFLADTLISKKAPQAPPANSQQPHTILHVGPQFGQFAGQAEPTTTAKLQ